MNHRFKIGDRVRVIGILADFYPGKIALFSLADFMAWPLGWTPLFGQKNG